MVFVLEPAAWADGTGGYRAEEVVAVTEGGYQLLSDFHYQPYVGVTAERRSRALAAMAEAGVDALLLGHEANARYVSGARRLPLSGARAFSPGCVLVAATGAVHLLSTSDDGVPADVSFEHLYAITWNPAKLMARLAAMPGLADARRVGVDGLTPFMEAQLTSTFPDAELVDGQSVMLAARQRKLPAEVEAIRCAVAIATAALDEVISLAGPGVRERDLLARFEQRMCELGTTTPAFEGTFGRAFPSDRALVAGERVVFDAGVLLDGYEGGLARTVVCGGAPEPNPADDLFTALLAAVAPATTGADLWAAWTRPASLGRASRSPTAWASASNHRSSVTTPTPSPPA